MKNHFFKKALSVLVAVLLICSIVPMAAFAEIADADVCKIGDVGYGTFESALKAAVSGTDTIVLLKDITDTSGSTRYNFGSKILTLDLNGFRLEGIAENATKTTVINSGEEGRQKMLAAVGTYGCDVSAFVAEDYAVKDEGKTVYYTILCKIGDDKYTDFGAAVAGAAAGATIVLVQDVISVDFEEKELTIDLNGCYLNGISSKAANVTITSGAENKATLAAIGTYAEDITDYVADGYDVSTTDNKTIFDNTGADVFSVKVVTSVSEQDDRDELTEASRATVDIFSEDIVDVQVRVYGARFVCANVTLTYNPDYFEVWDSPMSQWDEGDDSFTFYNAYNEKGKYFEIEYDSEAGEYYYVLGDFQFQALSTNGRIEGVPFQVKADASPYAEVSGDYANTFITGSWKQGSSTEALDPLDEENLTNGYVNIILKQMAVSVTANGPLTYIGSPLSLLKPGFQAKDTFTNALIDGASISYAVVDASVATGVQKKNDLDQPIYKDVKTGAETTTQKVTNEMAYEDDEVTPKVNEAGKQLYISYKDGSLTTDLETYNEIVYETAPSEPADSAYKRTQDQKTDAGEYAVFYKVTKAGYEPFISYQIVTIQPSIVTLTWSHEEVTTYTGEDGEENYTAAYLLTAGTKVGKESLGTTNFYADYRDAGYFDADGNSPIKATYIFNNVTYNADVTMTLCKGEEPADGTTLSDVGMYKYGAKILKNIGTSDAPEWVEDTNFTIKNPDCAVLIDGSTIEGYSLGYDEEFNNTSHAIFYDDQNHTGVKLVTADGATTGVTIVYSITNDFGKTWTDYDEIPQFKEAGTYTIKAKITKDKYYDLDLDPVTITLKNVVYKTEAVNYVLGWSIVLVYTNEKNVGFTYDGAYMFKMEGTAKYNYGMTLNSDKSRGTESYAYVYGIITNGDGDTRLVVPTNDYDKMKSLNNIKADEPLTYYDVYDVNVSDTKDPNDLVIVQDVYNVGATYFDEANKVVLSDTLMAAVMRADVSHDKMVDTMDINLVKVNTQGA